MNELVVLVDNQDNAIGVMPKLAAHEQGLLHRAFSVFICNSRGEILLQQRALNKYHSAGLWSNACCSHPRPVENLHEAAVRRLKEEMGMACEVKEVFSFIYKAHLENDLTEYEFDHVFVGISDEVPAPDPEEVAAWKYIGYKELIKEMEVAPASFTEWFKLCLKDFSDQLFDLK